MDVSNLEKVAVYSGGRIEWITEKFDNLVYLLSFEEGEYIGSTTNLRRRFAQYIADLTHNKYPAVKVQEAFNQSESFTVYCLEWVGDSENLKKREQFFINIVSPSLNSALAYSDKAKKKEKKTGVQLRIKELLKEKGLTQKDLAQKMGVAEISLSRSINGNPKLDTLEEIATALDVEVVDLFAVRGDFIAFVRQNGQTHTFTDFDELRAFVWAHSSELADRAEPTEAE